MSRDVPTLRETLVTYQLHYETTAFIQLDAISPVHVSEWFKEEIGFGLVHRGGDDKEAFTSEFVVVPFLKEVWKRHLNLDLFSHVRISADDVTVIPDYLLSSKDPTGYKTLNTPLLLTVEAKDEKFEEGWAQALLQAVICQKLNKNPEIPIYAIVTTGDTWQFGKLNDKLFQKHPFTASIQDIEKLVGILDALFAECERIANT